MNQSQYINLLYVVEISVLKIFITSKNKKAAGIAYGFLVCRQLLFFANQCDLLIKVEPRWYFLTDREIKTGLIFQ